MKHIVAVSGVQNDMAIGRQLTELEEGIKKFGVPYTIVIYPPFFIENYWGFKETITVKQSTISCPVDPENPS